MTQAFKDIASDTIGFVILVTLIYLTAVTWLATINYSTKPQCPSYYKVEWV